MSLFTKAAVGAAVAALSSSASAAILSHTFDLSGAVSEGSFGANFMVTSMVHNFGFAGTVIMIEWDVNYEAFSPSWMSEAQMAIDSAIDTTLDADVDPGAFGAADAPGVFSFSGTLAANTASADGIVYLTLYESFDDGINPDARYGQGSWFKVYFDAPGAVIPAPGGVALLGGLGLIGAARRRRG